MRESVYVDQRDFKISLHKEKARSDESQDFESRAVYIFPIDLLTYVDSELSYLLNPRLENLMSRVPPFKIRIIKDLKAVAINVKGWEGEVILDQSFWIEYSDLFRNGRALRIAPRPSFNGLVLKVDRFQPRVPKEAIGKKKPEQWDLKRAVWVINELTYGPCRLTQISGDINDFRMINLWRLPIYQGSMFPGVKYDSRTVRFKLESDTHRPEGFKSEKEAAIAAAEYMIRTNDLDGIAAINRMNLVAEAFGTNDMFFRNYRNRMGLPPFDKKVDREALDLDIENEPNPDNE